MLLTGKFKVAAFSSAGPFDRDVGIPGVYHPEGFFFYLFATFGWSFLLNLYGNSILVLLTLKLLVRKAYQNGLGSHSFTVGNEIKQLS